jgi:hypothetical protein
VEYLPQASEPTNFPYGLTEGDLKDGYHIKFYDEGYFKYKLEGQDFWVIAIYIKKEYREKKKGTMLMLDAERIARGLGAKVMKVDATTDGKTDVLGRFLVSLNYKDSGKYIWCKNI